MPGGNSRANPLTRAACTLHRFALALLAIAGFASTAAGQDWTRFAAGIATFDSTSIASGPAPMVVDRDGNTYAAWFQPLELQYLRIGVVARDAGGAVKWRRDFGVLRLYGSHVSSPPIALALAGADPVIAYSLDGAAPRVARMRTEDGQVLWSSDFAAVGRLARMTTDAAGDVVLIARSAVVSGLGEDLDLIKLAASDGRALWSTRIDVVGRTEIASELRIVPGGDVMVTGCADLLGSAGCPAFAARYDGSNGSPVWTTQPSGVGGAVWTDNAVPTSVDASGNLYLAGPARNGTGFSDRSWLVVALAGDSGQTRWTAALPLPANASNHVLSRMVFDDSGVLLARGSRQRSAGHDVLIAAWQSATGNLVWEQEPAGLRTPTEYSGGDLIVDGQGTLLYSAVTLPGPALEIRSLDIASGTPRTKTVLPNLIEPGLVRLAHLAMGDSRVLAGGTDTATGERDLVLAAVDARAAAIRWQHAEDDVANVVSLPCSTSSLGDRPIAVDDSGAMVIAGCLQRPATRDRAFDLDFVVLDADGQQRWRKVRPGGTSAARVLSTAFATNGDVIYVAHAGSQGQAEIIAERLAAGSGDPVWSQRLRETWSPTAVAIADDDVVIAGSGTLVRHAGLSGARRWRWTENTTSMIGRIGGLAVNANGDVMTVGIANGRLRVGKHRGSDGVPIWQSPPIDVWPGLDRITGDRIVVDASGDPIVAWASASTGTFLERVDARVMKLAGNDGTTRWQAVLSDSTGLDSELTSLVVLPDGDVAVSRNILDPFSNFAPSRRSRSIIANRLSATTGVVRHRSVLLAPGFRDVRTAGLVALPGGDLVLAAAGVSVFGNTQMPLVARFAADGGQQRWLNRVELSSGSSFPYALATASDGSLRVAASYLDNQFVSRTVGMRIDADRNADPRHLIAVGAFQGRARVLGDGVDCGLDCMTLAPAGARIEVRAKAAIGFSVRGWFNGCADGANTGNDARCEIDARGPINAEPILTPTAASFDFSGLGRSEGLWLDWSSGETAIRRLASAESPGDQRLLLDPDWRVVASVDLNADRRSDLVWQHDRSGEICLWLMGGRVRLRQQCFPFDAARRVRFAAGTHSNGEVMLYWADAQRGQTGALAIRDFAPQAVTVISNNRHQRLVAATSVTGRSRGVLVWHDVHTGEHRIDVMQFAGEGSGVQASAVAPVPRHATLRASGDLDGNDFVDYVWQDPTAARTFVTLMEGTQLRRRWTISEDPNVVVTGTLDDDGDGRDDLIVRGAKTTNTSIWRIRDDKDGFEVINLGAHPTRRLYGR
jgi:outer membrane protein assembly factor BamB